MAPKNIQMAILAALDDLVGENLEKFCLQLLSRKRKRVGESMVKGKSRVHITSVLVQTYTEKGALKVVLETLKDAGFAQTAQKLAKDTRKHTKQKRKAGGTSGAAASGRVRVADAEDEMDSSEDPAKSFIRDQKVKLITCLAADSLILQFAHQEDLITQGEYRKLKSTSSTDDTVRDLIDIVIEKGPDHCCRFLNILKERDVVKTYPLLTGIMKDWK